MDVLARARLRHRIEEELRSITVVRPFDERGMSQQVARTRGRPVHVHTTKQLPGAYGFWLETRTTDHVYISEGVGRLHRNLILLHELAHMLLNHQASVALASLFPLTFDAGATMLARRGSLGEGYADEPEAEAELLASLILAESGWEPVDDTDPASRVTCTGGGESAKAGEPADPVLVRLEEAFRPQDGR